MCKYVWRYRTVCRCNIICICPILLHSMKYSHSSWGNDNDIFEEGEWLGNFSDRDFFQLQVVQYIFWLGTYISLLVARFVWFLLSFCCTGVYGVSLLIAPPSLPKNLMVDRLGLYISNSILLCCRQSVFIEKERFLGVTVITFIFIPSQHTTHDLSYSSGDRDMWSVQDLTFLSLDLQKKMQSLFDTETMLL